MSFPEGFLWGGDISAAQCEGAWNEGGKAPIEADYLLGGSKKSMRFAWYRLPDGAEGKTMQMAGQLPAGARYILQDGAFYPNHRSVDFYHRYREDIALFAELGIKAINLSVSWARIYPNGVAGGVNQKGLDYYRDLLTLCREHNIEPIVTLYKYDLPVFYLEDWGGWSNRALIDEYVTFATTCLKEFRGLAHYWITFNELNVLKLMAKINPVATAEDRQRVYEESHNQLVASARVVAAGHEIDAENKLGCMCAGMFGYTYTSDPIDAALVQRGAQDDFYYFADTIVRGAYPSFAVRTREADGATLDISEEDAAALQAGKADFLPFSYYATSCRTIHGEGLDRAKGNLVLSSVKNPYLETSAWGWQIDAEGLKTFLHELYDRYQIPLLIAENGLGVDECPDERGRIHDDYRIDYLGKHLVKAGEAIDEGVDLIGYTMWSLIDLVSFSSGELKKRYGLIYVDADDEGNGTFDRLRKDSFYWYQRVISTNGKELPPKI